MQSQHSLKRTKVICSIGPATSSVEQLQQLLNNGMSIARLNFSHGTYEEKQVIFDNFKVLRGKGEHFFGVAIDTKGPEIRIKLKEKEKNICRDDEIQFVTQEKDLTDENIFLNLQNLFELKENYIFSIDDGILKMKITKIKDGCFTAKALNDHVLKNNKGANFPNIDLGMPYLSTKDKNDIEFGLQNEADYIFASFVNSKNDIEQLNSFLLEAFYKPIIIAKIESQRGIQNIDEIIDCVDGIMIARGDLCAEIPFEKMLATQKMIIKKCLEKNKSIIVATQMLESMNYEQVPTRAEVSDVGNAVLDYCDAVMLSSETATGKYPILSAAMMSSICLETEKFEIDAFQNLEPEKKELLMGKAIKKMSKDKDVKAIVVITDNMEELLSIWRKKQKIPLIVASKDLNFLRKLSIMRGIIPQKIAIDIKNGDGLAFQTFCNEQVFMLKNKYEFEEGNAIIFYFKPSENEEIIKKMIV